MSIPPLKVILAVTSATALAKLGESSVLVCAANVAREFARATGDKSSVSVAMPGELSDAVVTQLVGAQIDFIPLICDPNNPIELAAALAPERSLFELVAVHDSNRPLTRLAQFHRTLEALLTEVDAVRASSAFTETLKSVSKAELIEYTIDRTSIRRISTPEIYRMSAIDFKLQDPKKSTGWFLPLTKSARIGYVDSDPESIRVNSEDELSLLESFLHWQQTVAR